MAVYFREKSLRCVHKYTIPFLAQMCYNKRNETADRCQKKGVIWQRGDPMVKAVLCSCPVAVGKSR